MRNGQYRLCLLLPLRFTFACSAALLVWMVVHQPTVAQEKTTSDKKEPKKELVETDKTLMNEIPFDLVVMKPEAGGEEVRVLPIEFPNRVVPESPDPSSKIVVTMVQYPDRKYEVRWKDIKKIVTFEEQVLLDARKMMEKKEYAAAFEHLDFLIKYSPQTGGLDKLKEDFLFTSASEMFAQQRLPHTLAVLEELQRTYPSSRVQLVRTGLSNVADKLIQGYVNSGDLRAAQMLLARLKKDYATKPLDVVERWEGEFRRQATELMERGRTAMTDGKMREARAAAAGMLAIQPDLPGGKELLAEMIKAYPMVRIGAFQRSNRPDPTSLTDWAGRRSGELVSKPLFRFKKTGPEGGDYKFAMGNFLQSDDRRELELDFNKGTSFASPSVAQWLLQRAEPKSKDYRASWGAILQDVRMESPERLIVRLKKPHVLPQALLQWPTEALPGLAGTTSAGAYRIGEQTELESSFVWGLKEPPETGRPMEIVERFYEDPRKAVMDLMRGELDAIDQLYPADVKLLKGIPGIKVEQYELPTVHMLVPKSDHRYLRESTFRRALMYGINREAVLQDEILGGTSVPGCSVVSGPFPLGLSDNDLLSYAYNTRVEPMPYDRTLAKLLVILTEKDIASHAARKKIPVPNLEKIRLGVPNVTFAKAAGEAFVQQWGILGIPAELVILPTGVTEPAGEDIDLLYVTAAIWEPATDAERLLGPDGIAATNDPFIVQALGTLRTSRSWTEVRKSLQELHKLIDDHLPILPLWQVNDSLAYRTNLRGFDARPKTLYQSLDQWRLTGEQK